jgi:hypothetical protein
MRVVAWVVFTLAWGFAALVTFFWTGMGWCGGDGGSPYAAPASPRGEYCAAIDDGGTLFFVAVAVFFALLVVGLFLVRTHPRIVVALATVAIGLLAAHIVTVSALSPRCTPDDPGLPGCAHY